jgi:hypothetical protein
MHVWLLCDKFFYPILVPLAPQRLASRIDLSESSALSFHSRVPEYARNFVLDTPYESNLRMMLMLVRVTQVLARYALAHDTLLFRKPLMLSIASSAAPFPGPAAVNSGTAFPVSSSTCMGLPVSGAASNRSA